MSNKTKRKPLRLQEEQADALVQWAADFKRTHHMRQETAAVAQRLFAELVNAPRWDLVDSEQPAFAQGKQPEMWTVGHAKVNITDHRKQEGDS